LQKRLQIVDFAGDNFFAAGRQRGCKLLQANSLGLEVRANLRMGVPEERPNTQPLATGDRDKASIAWRMVARN
jgi:hypothetical protein